MILESLRGKIRTYQFIKLWRKINSHNGTVPGNTFDINTVNVGNYTYGTINVLKHSSTKEKLYIGHCCSIAPNVEFILGSDHPYFYLSTFPFKVKVFDEQSEAISKGDIRVGDDVWIGYGSIILSGVKINQGAIVAAGSVVTKDVPPYAIVGGNPAKIIKYRFDDNIIKQLIKFDFSNINDKLIRQHLKDLYMPIEDNNNLQFIMK